MMTQEEHSPLFSADVSALEASTATSIIDPLVPLFVRSLEQMAHALRSIQQEWQMVHHLSRKLLLFVQPNVSNSAATEAAAGSLMLRCLLNNSIAQGGFVLRETAKMTEHLNALEVLEDNFMTSEGMKLFEETHRRCSDVITNALALSSSSTPSSCIVVSQIRQGGAVYFKEDQTVVQSTTRVEGYRQLSFETGRFSEWIEAFLKHSRESRGSIKDAFTQSIEKVAELSQLRVTETHACFEEITRLLKSLDKRLETEAYADSTKAPSI